MSASSTRSTTAQSSGFVDELQAVFEESMQDPEFRAIHEDAENRRRIIEMLIALRKARHLTQKDVAARMAVGQSTISGFETEGADPRLSTLQRYARAVEAHCDVAVRVPKVCDWVTPATYSEVTPAPTAVRVDFFTSSEQEQWAMNTARNDFALAS